MIRQVLYEGDDTIIFWEPTNGITGHVYVWKEPSPSYFKASHGAGASRGVGFLITRYLDILCIDRKNRELCFVPRRGNQSLKRLFNLHMPIRTTFEGARKYAFLAVLEDL
jgi:hypothetical protein